MAQPINTLSHEVIAELGEMKAYIDRMRRGGTPGPHEPSSRFREKQVRIAKTTVGLNCTSYPEPPANTFVVSLGRGDYLEECGYQAHSFEPYVPGELRYAHSLADQYYKEGEVVIIVLIHDKWYILPDGADLVLLSPATCFSSWPVEPTKMILWEVDGCEWKKTTGTVAAVDPNDTNFLLPDETQWARLRKGCTALIEGEYLPLYDLVGSRGLRRRVKANADIACDTLGSATVWETKGCADTEQTACQIDVCNNWGLRACIKDNDELEAQYVARGVWSPIHRRNARYLAALSGAMCPDETGDHEVTAVQGLDYCEEATVWQAITKATNKFGLSGLNGDWLFLERDNTVCEDTFYITQVLHKCRDVAVTIGGACGGTQFLQQDCAEIKGSVQQKVSLMSCTESPILAVQISLESIDAVSNSVIGQTGCAITQTNTYTTFYGFTSCESPPGPSVSAVTFSKSQAITSVSIEDCEGQNAPSMRLHQSYFLTLQGCTGDAGYTDLPLVGKQAIDECLRVACDANGSNSLEAHFSTIYGLCSRPVGWEACIAVSRCDGEECIPTIPPPPLLPLIEIEEEGEELPPPDAGGPLS